MFQSIEQLLKYVGSQKIEMIDLKYCDLEGRWRHITLPGSYITKDVFEKGVGFDGSNMAGFKSIEGGDLVLIPDPATGMMDPFWEIDTLSLICNIHEADTLEPFRRDPRRIAGAAEKYLVDSGIATESRWSPEFEFYILDKVDFFSDVSGAGYNMDKDGAFWNSMDPDMNNSGFSARQKGGYHRIPPMDNTYNMRSKMVQLLEKAGVPVKYHHTEVGGCGQVEIEIPMNAMAKQCDASMIIKYVVRNVAKAFEMTAAFMPKPFFDEAGSGIHYHINLFKDDEPIFYDKEKYAGLSATALHFIGGLLKHGKALTAITNPSTNSYKRLAPGFEAPVYLIFGLANRCASVRIPKYANDPHTKRIEYRVPDATGNPYISMAALLMAGIDGVRNEILPDPKREGPIDENIFKWSEDKLGELATLPVSLDKALDELEKDHAFLLEGEVFTENLIQTWIEIKRAEAREIEARPHPHEFTLYYDL